MAWYRALTNLTIKGKIISRNAIFNHELKHANRLISQGVISELNTPPLIELPNWFERAYLLQENGIFLGIDLLNSNNQQLANLLDLEVETIQFWKDELINLLIIPDSNKPCCGG